MVDLYGSLASFEIAPLAEFLSAMRKTGDLQIVDGPLSGQLSFNAGQLVAASVGDERGCAALEFIVGAMRRGEFEFVERDTAEPRDIDLEPNALLLLQELAATPAWVCPELTSVPRLVADLDSDASCVTLTRSELHLLLQIDARRDITALSGDIGLIRTLRGLRNLSELGFLEFSAADSTQPVHSASATGHRVQPLRVLAEVVQAVVCTALVVMAVRSVVLNFKVDGISMQPNFQSGQVLLVNRAAYFHLDWQGGMRFLFGGPRRGDVAIFHSPIQPGTDYIKRVVGLPGDRVNIHDGTVFVNDAAVSEPYIRAEADYRFPDNGVATVPSDSYFVLGDNRPESLDSHFGWFVPVADLVGKAWLRYWPPEALGVIQAG